MTADTLPPALAEFVDSMARIIDQPEALLLAQGTVLLKSLISDGSWLAPEFREPDAEHYRQYLLFCDREERFSVVSFVWGPGQSTPIHNHMVWGLVGVLEGAEIEQAYRRRDAGLSPQGAARRLDAGSVSAIFVDDDIHRVSNAFDDRVSISIHIYGGNIGSIRRATFTTAGDTKPFVSGFANVPASPSETTQ